MAKVYFRVTLPDELFQPLMQAIRDFDTKHDPKHEGKIQFESLAETDFPVEKLEAVMKTISPSFPVTVTKRFDN